MKTCSVEGCDREVHAKDLCMKHYQRTKAERDRKSCSIEGCDNYCKFGDYCGKHYAQLYKYGNITDTRFDNRPAIVEGDIAKIPLGIKAKDGYTIVDKDFTKLGEYKYSLGTRGYATRNIPGKHIYLHHDIMGKPQEGIVVDHINRDKLDNRLCNLRFCIKAENVMNQKNQNNKTGERNITLGRNGSYQCAINIKGKRHYIGYSKDINELIEKRDKFIKENNIFIFK